MNTNIRLYSEVNQKPRIQGRVGTNAKPMFLNFRVHIRFESYKWIERTQPWYNHAVCFPPKKKNHDSIYLVGRATNMNRNVCCMGFWINASNPIVSDSQRFQSSPVNCWTTKLNARHSHSALSPAPCVLSAKVPQPLLFNNNKTNHRSKPTGWKVSFEYFIRN